MILLTKRPAVLQLGYILHAYASRLPANANANANDMGPRMVMLWLAASCAGARPLHIAMPSYPKENPTNLDVAGRLRNVTAHVHALETFAEQARQDLWLMRMTLHARTTLLDEDAHGEGAPLRVIAERKEPVPLDCEGELRLDSSHRLLEVQGDAIAKEWTRRAMGRDIAPEALDVAQYVVHIAECTAKSLDLAEDLSSSGAVAQLGCLHEELLGAATSRVTFDAHQAMSEMRHAISRSNATLRALREKHARSQEGSGAASLPENPLLPENSVQGLVVSEVLQPMEAATVRMLAGVGQLLNVVRSLIGDESGRSARKDGEGPSFGANETEAERRGTRFSSFFVECCFLERGRAATDDMASPTSLYAPQCVSHWSRQREWRHWRLALTYELRRADSPLGQALRDVLKSESAAMRPSALLADIERQFEDLEARMLERVRIAIAARE